MSEFHQDLTLAFHSPASFESAEPEVPQSAPVEPAAITVDDIMDTREEREEVADAACEVPEEVERDLKFIDKSEQIAEVVTGAVQAASNVEPAHAEAFVTAANGVIKDASQTLQVDIPLLANVADGSVDQVSLESLTGWLGTAAKAFAEATGRFFTRMKTGWLRLNTSVGGFKGRIQRVRTKMVSRKGNGGKALKLDRDIIASLIVGDGIPSDYMAGANALAKVVSEASAILGEYQARVDAKIKTAVFEAVSGRENDRFLVVDQNDLNTRFDKLLNEQPKLMFGNQRLEKLERRMSQVLCYALVNKDPQASELAKHVDAPVSLSNEQIRALLDQLDPAVAEYLRQVEKLADLAERSQSNCKAMLGRLMKEPEGGDDTDLDVEFNDTELLRIENELVGELARISSRQMQFAGAVIAAYNAVLTVAEESIFQD